MALKERFPTDYSVLAKRAGDGFGELLANADVLDQARHARAYGLLAGKGLTVGQRSVPSFWQTRLNRSRNAALDRARRYLPER